MAHAGEPAPGHPLLLEPVPPLIPGDSWKRQVAGSSLSWDPATRVLTYVPPRKRPEGGWRLIADHGPHVLRAVVHVRGDLPYQVFGSSVAAYGVDAYAFVDASDVPLVPGVESGAAEFFAGWFRPAAMGKLAEAMGVEVREDRVASWRDLNTRYAGLISASGAWERIARAGGVTFSAFGALAISMGLVGIVVGIVARTPVAVAVAALLVLPLGLAAIHVARELFRGAGSRPRRPRP